MPSRSMWIKSLKQDFIEWMHKEIENLNKNSWKRWGTEHTVYSMNEARLRGNKKNQRQHYSTRAFAQSPCYCGYNQYFCLFFFWNWKSWWNLWRYNHKNMDIRWGWNLLRINNWKKLSTKRIVKTIAIVYALVRFMPNKKMLLRRKQIKIPLLLGHFQSKGLAVSDTYVYVTV